MEAQHALRAFALATVLTCADSGRADSYTVSVPAGYSAVGLNLDSGSNRLSVLFPNPPDFANVFRWNGAGYDTATYFFGAWDNDYALAVGEGIIFYNTDTIPVDLTVTGTRLVPQPRPRLPDGNYYLVACRTPDPCGFDDMMGYPPRVGDRVQFFDRATASFTNAHMWRTFLGSGGWDVTPVVGIGEAVFVYLAPPDTTPPTVLSTTGSFRLDVVMITFSERVTLNTATNRANYQITGGILVSGALLSPNGTSVFLRTSPQIAGSNYVVTVNNVADISGNVIASGVQLAFTAPRPEPVILQPPQSQAVGVGSNATFSVVASGLERLSYQWETNGADLPGAIDATLVVKGVTAAMDGVQFTVRVTNSAGAITSAPAVLTVLLPPIINVHPAGRIVVVGASVTLTVQASGRGPLRYQWRLNGANIPGAISDTLTIANMKPADFGGYRCTVANAFGAAHSQEAKLGGALPVLPFTDNFLDARLPETDFTSLGRGSNVGAGREPGEPLHARKRGGHSVWFTWLAPADGIATFAAVGSGFDTLLAVYRGLVLTNLFEVAADDDAAGFYGSTVSFNAAVGESYYIAVDGFAGATGDILLGWQLEPTFEKVPDIVKQPVSQTVAGGGSVTFTFTATGSGLAYQWFFNGTFLVGETNATLTIPSVQTTNVGAYFVVARSGTRLIKSQPVQLQITTAAAAAVQGPESNDKFGETTDNQPAPPQGLSVHAARRVIPHSAPARGYTGTQIFSTYGAQKEAGEPNHCGVVGGASQWFSCQAENDGTLYIKTDGSDFDTVLAVYAGPGDSFDTLVSVACNNNPGVNGSDRVNFPATRDEIYWIAVDGVGGVSGNVELTYTLVLPLSMTPPVIVNGTNISFQVSTSPSLPFSIQESVNLLTWTTLLTTNTASGLYGFTNSSPANISGRFYRVTMLP